MAGEVWIRMLGFIPYLSSPASSNTLGVALHIRTARRSYPGADRGGPGLAHQPSASAGQQSGDTTTQKWNVPHIPYVWRFVGSGIVVTIASTPMTSAARRPIGLKSWS
jgi:hypothetical protein